MRAVNKQRAGRHRVKKSRKQKERGESARWKRAGARMIAGKGYRGWRKRELGDNEGRHINIRGMRRQHLSLSLSLLLAFSSLALARSSFRPRRLVRQIAIATASLITRSSFLPPRPRRTSSSVLPSPRRVYTLVTSVRRLPAIFPGHTVAAAVSSWSARSLTLDTVPPIHGIPTKPESGSFGRGLCVPRSLAGYDRGHECPAVFLSAPG